MIMFCKDVCDWSKQTVPGSTLESRPSLFQVTSELTNSHVIFIGILPISGWIKSKSSKFTNQPFLFTCQVMLEKNDKKNKMNRPYPTTNYHTFYISLCHVIPFRMSQPLDMDPPKNLQPASWLGHAKNRTLRPIDQVDDFHALQPLDPGWTDAMKRFQWKADGFVWRACCCWFVAPKSGKCLKKITSS